MPTKDVYLFDSSNTPLRVHGIVLKLFDAHSGTLLDSQLSTNLNPGNPASNEWGAKLTFMAGSTPVDVYVTDTTYKYPGGTVKYLNGRTTDRLDIDLAAVPATVGGQTGAPASSAPRALFEWVNNAPYWNVEEKRAVWNLISNYIQVIVPRIDALPSLHNLAEVATNWEETLNRVGVPPAVLRR